jgi:hypothetical protein
MQEAVMHWKDITDNTSFQRDFASLEQITLNPHRHTAPNGKIHSEWVSSQARLLAEANGCTAEEQDLLALIGLVHDIGKSRGDSHPSTSLELLEEYGVSDETVLSLVKYHDTNLPWYLSSQSGQAPGDKAWKRLAKRVNMKLLCLFMVADRVDCPGGWRNNPPLMWFLEEAMQRGFASPEWELDMASDDTMPVDAPLPKWQ